MQNGMIDLYVRGNNSVAYSEIYSSFASEKNSYISDLLLLVINNDSSKVRKHGETYEVAGVRFTADQIPKIDTNKLLEIKACNNIIDFGQNHYFKYVSSDGKEHALFTNDKGVGVPYSEHMRGAEHDAVAQRYTHFWRYMMNDDPVYVGLTYSNDDIDEFMKHAGIENGFFTVRMGNREATQYYTKSENHTLDIPYGEDLWCLEYPLNYRFWEKLINL